MSEPRLIGEIIAEIMADLRELQERYDIDCNDPILSCKEAASLLGKTPQTISHYISEGRLHKVSNGVKVGIAKSELQKFFRAST